MNSARDLDRAYTGTYLGLQEDGVVVPVYVEGVESREVSALRLVRPDGDCRMLMYTSPDIVYQYPDLGYSMLDDEPVWLERVPQRQWHRGIKPNLVTVVRTNNSLSTLREFPISSRYQILESVYNPQYTETFTKDYVVHSGVIYYRGLRLCEEGALDDLPDELDYIKRYIKGGLNAEG